MRKFERGDLLNRDLVYSGKIVELIVDEIQLGGRRTLREVVHHPGGVGILAEIEPGLVPLVRQHRYPVDKDLLEIPAGKMEPGEDPIDTAVRELEEETGYRPVNIRTAFNYYPTPGYCDELLHIYHVDRAEKTSINLDDDEDLEIELYHLAESLEMVEQGEIRDGKTIAALYWLVLEKIKRGDPSLPPVFRPGEMKADR